jgi:peptide/nickel transport system permease protein
VNGVDRSLRSQAAISFVKPGVQPPTPSWGNMLSSAREYLLYAVGTVLAGGVI